MRWIKYIFSYSIFISLCAVALCFQTAILARIQHPADVYAFVFFSTLASYNFYWLLSKYSFQKIRNIRNLVLSNKGNSAILIVASAGMLYYGIRLDYLYIPIVISIVLTLVYSIPLWPSALANKARKAGILKPVILALTWTFVTVIFPVYDQIDNHPTLVGLIFLTRFFLMIMLCMIFDMRDSSVDRSRAFHSLATDLKPSHLKNIMRFLFIFYVISGIASRYILHDRWQIISFILTGIFVWLIYLSSLRKRDYFFYYFVVDGVMVVSTLFTWIASNI